METTATPLVCENCGRDLRTPDHPYYSSEYQLRTLDDGTRGIVCAYGQCYDETDRPATEPAPKSGPPALIDATHLARSLDDLCVLGSLYGRRFGVEFPADRVQALVLNAAVNNTGSPLAVEPAFGLLRGELRQFMEWLPETQAQEIRDAYKCVQANLEALVAHNYDAWDEFWGDVEPF